MRNREAGRIVLALLLAGGVASLAAQQSQQTKTANTATGASATAAPSPAATPDKNTGTPTNPSTQTRKAEAPPATAAGDAGGEYLLGPDDSVKIWALGVEEITDKPIRIDPAGFIDLPLLGRVKAAGLSTTQLKDVLITKLAKEVRRPQVSVELIEFGSQPVSVIGAVATPGVHQLRGRRTLAEVLSLAGGLRPDAGPVIKVTRQIEWGEVPLAGATTDPSGKFSIAEVKVRDLLGASTPAENIMVRPHDVVTVPVAQQVFVIGAVRKPGGFSLSERQGVSVLQALAAAEGFGPTPSPGKSKILRTPPGSSERTEIAVDLKKIMNGQAEDVMLRPNDILFVPDSRPQKAGIKAIDAAVQAATGVAIWRRF